jgi:hypothetical protein
MVCSNCGNQAEASERFCRKCGTDLRKALSVPPKQSVQKSVANKLGLAPSKDPDELTGNGIGSVIMGDGFLMVAVILGVTHTAVSSLLWLLLLIPAFFFFGKGFADVLHARQIHRRLKQHALDDPAPTTGKLPPPRVSIAEVLKHHTSGELLTTPSVTETTTRHLG